MTHSSPDARVEMELMSSVGRVVAVAAVLALCVGTARAGQKADLVRVDKSKSRLYLLRDGEVFETLRASFG